MPATTIANVTLSYPSPDMVDGVTTPILSQAQREDLAVTLRLRQHNKRQQVEATVVRFRDDAEQTLPLTRKDLQLMQAQTRERQVVGLMQPHYADTILRWVQLGRLNVFGELDEHDTQHSA